jgi:hypothetical protein
MKKNNKLLLFTLSIFTTTACRIQSSGEYEGLLSSDPLTLLSRLKVADILGDNSLLYLISTVGGVLFFILGIIFFFLHRKD